MYIPTIEEAPRSHASVIFGLVATLLVHAGALELVSYSGIKCIYPPPEETSFVIDFTVEAAEMPKPKKQPEPQSETPDREKSVNVVKKSTSPSVAPKSNPAPATADNGFGDVETPAPPVPQEPVIDSKALFPGMSKKKDDSTSPLTSDESTPKFSDGHAKGNSLNAQTNGKPNAHVEGRKVIGGTPLPAYNVQDAGYVVVKIHVDQYGTVIKALPGVEGTTITNKELWEAARKAALETHFNIEGNAPQFQEGTITYYFNLK